MNTIAPQLFINPDAPPVPIEQIVDDLLRTAEVIRQVGWCQGSLRSPEGKVCLSGAVTRALCEDERTFRRVIGATSLYWAGSDRYMAAMGALANAIAPPTDPGPLTLTAQAKPISFAAFGIPVRWNDKPARTEEEVITLIEQTAANLKGQQ